MRKEPYLKPEVTSEMLEPGELGVRGSPEGGGGDGGGGGGGGPIQALWPLFGICCN
jgi:hypothetical protein